EPVYDIEATAFRRFFELPGEEQAWHFDVPAFGVRFIALDLHHLSDTGTTWQSSQAFQVGSPQYEWYRQLIGENKNPRPEAVVLGWPPRGGRFRAVAPSGGGDAGEGPAGASAVTRSRTHPDDVPAPPARGCTSAPGPHPG